MNALETAMLQRTSTEAAPPSSKPVRKPRDYRLPGRGSTLRFSVLSVTTLLVLWWAVTTLYWAPPLFLPSPQAVGCAFTGAWHGGIQDGQPSVAHLGQSALRVLDAFALTAMTAIPIGLATGVPRTARGLFDSPIEFYRPLPPLAYLPLVVIWLGINECAKIVVVYPACFAPIAMAARAGVRNAILEQINAAYALGAGLAQVVRHVILPAVLSEILTGLRIAIGPGWITPVTAEMVAATVGVEQMVLNASSFLRIDPVVMGIVSIDAIVWALGLAIHAIEACVVPWKGRSQPRPRSCS